MDKTVLKNFAIESRKELMEKIDRKIKLFYIDEEFKRDNRGDVIVLSNDKHTLTLTKEDDYNRDNLIKRIVELGYEKVVEEAAYTWFNRIIAIRYLEIHDYLPLTKENQSLSIRVLSSKDNKPEPEILKFTNLSNKDLDIGFNKDVYSSCNSEDEKFKYIIKLICKKLSSVIPNVFGDITDYIDLLIPDNMLNLNGFVYKLINNIEEEEFDKVEIIGWLYQYYIFELKDEYKEEKKTYDKDVLPVMTQIFTTDEIVKYMVENSLVKKISECGVDSEKHKFEVKDNYISSSTKSIENIKFIDPCCGSGHILVYAFEILYDAYLKLGYSKNDISTNILTKNLYGIDVDDRAAQLTTLSLLLQARNYDKNIFSKNIELNVSSIVESNNIKNIDMMNISKEAKNQLHYLYNEFYDAKEYGSILKLSEYDFDELTKEINENNDIFIVQEKSLINRILKLRKILTTKYDVYVTNPPYLGIRAFDEKLKTYVDNNYKLSKHDLCTVFMDTQFLKDDGIMGMVNQTTWLTQDSFSAFRKEILENNTLLSMLILDKNVMDAGLDICTFIISKMHNENINTNYYVVTSLDNGVAYDKMYSINNARFINSKDHAILYNLSENLFNIYQNSIPLSEVAPTKQGLATSDNNRFLREWHEVDFQNIGFDCEKSDNHKWYPCNKGGNYRKWYGNFNKIINWENDGYEIKEYAKKLYKSYTRTIKNIPYYFKPGITWNSLAKELGCRIVPKGFIFETKGSMMFPNDDNNLYYILGLTNSKVINTLAKVISPTLDFHEGPVGKLPVIINNNYKETIEKLVIENIEISKEDWDSSEISWNYKRNKLVSQNTDTIEEAYKMYIKEKENKTNILKQNEEKLNEIFINIYNLGNELTKEISEDDLTISKTSKLDEIKSLISYSVGCMFGRYSLDKEGLSFAGGTINESIYNSFKPDEDNIIPISDNEDIYYNDDIVGCFKNFIKCAFNPEKLNNNLDFIAEVLGKKGTESSEDTIRRYFVNDFYKDHIKLYQKRPIYWLFDSGKKNGFKCLMYLHRYDEQIVSKIRTKYLHNTLSIYQRTVDEIDYKLNNNELSTTDKRELQNKKVDLNNKIAECNEYEEMVGNVANKMIKLDLDDGVATNYSKFVDDNNQSILASIK